MKKPREVIGVIHRSVQRSSYV